MEELDDEGKLCSMILEANKNVRYAAVCNADGKILWNCKRNDVDNILTLEETKASLKRAIKTWQERDELSDKIGKGRYAIVGYEKIKRITIPLKNNQLLFLSVQPDKPEYIGDVMNIIKWIEEHPLQT